MNFVNPEISVILTAFNSENILPEQLIAFSHKHLKIMNYW